MLDKFLKKGNIKNKFDVIFVDEAQDLSLIQWAVINKLEKENKGVDIWIAGDDDQAIFGWAGADVNSFINWKAEKIPLEQSERVPSQIQQIALSIIERVEENRLNKNYHPKKEKGEIFERFKLIDIEKSQISKDKDLKNSREKKI
jgi:superfamily I DNA/RNA helicase